jgi:hypothetical protein
VILTEEEWAERQRHREHGGSSSKTPGDKKGKPRGKKKPHGGEKPTSNRGGGSGERKKGACRYCGIEGHFAKECRKGNRDREKLQRLNLSQAEPEEDSSPALMMASDTIIELEPLHTVDHSGVQHVFLNEDCKFATTQYEVWSVSVMALASSVGAALRQPLCGSLSRTDGCGRRHKTLEFFRRTNTQIFFSN